MKKIPLSLLWLFIALVLFLYGCDPGGREVRLAYKFDPARKYHFVYDSKSNYKAYENNILAFSGDSVYSIAYVQEVVQSIDSASARLKFTYSQKGHSPENWSTEYIMSSNGDIKEILGNDAPNSLEYYRKLFEQTSPDYPSEPVTEGFVWKHTAKVLLTEGLTEAVTNYKVKAFVREAGYDCAVIEYTGEMIIPLAPNCNGANTVTSGKDKIQVTGVTYLAYAEGIDIKDEATSHLIREGNISIDGRNSSFRIEEDRTYKNMLVEIDK